MGFGFEKHLRKRDPFVIEFSWKFLPGLGCREGAMTPPCGGQRCGFAAVWFLLGGALSGCCSTAISSGTKLSWGSFYSFSSCALFPSWQYIPALHLDISLVRQFFVWHLCALHCGKSWSWEHRVFLPFWREPPAGHFLLLGPRQEPGMKLEAKAAIKVGDEVHIKHWTSHSTPSNILWKIYTLEPPSSAFHSFTGCFLPSTAVRWFPTQKGQCAPTGAGSPLASPRPLAPAHRVGFPEQSHTQHREGAQPERLQAIWASNEQPINWLQKV